MVFLESHFFYFAFENNLCPDYVTEKFLRFTKLIVPIVIKRDIVPKRFPADMFIAVDDFDNLKEFTGYLQKVASNTTLYKR